jgi:hypothetical protein
MPRPRVIIVLYKIKTLWAGLFTSSLNREVQRYRALCGRSIRKKTSHERIPNLQFNEKTNNCCKMKSRGSSGSIVSDYGLDYRAIEVRSPAGADFSSSPRVQTGSGPTQPPIQWVPGVKRGRGVTLTTQPHLVPRLRMSRSYTSSPLMCLHGV